MALDGLMLHTICSRLQFLVKGRIGKIQNLSSEEIVMHVHTRSEGNVRLVFNIHPNTNRLFISQTSFPLAPEPNPFVMVLRKYLSQSTILSITQADFDRILCFEIAAHNEFGDTVIMKLYAELMGKYANLILAGGSGKIIDAARRIPVFENSKRLIHPGADYALPEQSLRQNPMDVHDLDLDRSLVDQVQGFSPLISREVIHRLKQGQNFKDIMAEIFSSNTLYVYDSKNFHAIELTHLEKPYKTYELMNGLAHIYTDNEKKNRISQTAPDVISCVNKEYRRLLKKIPKLQDTLKKADEAETFREYGDLLFVYQDELEKKPVVEVESFDSGQIVKIPLNMRYDIKSNANLYYKKYHKLKRSKEVLNEQIEQAENELAYFGQLKEQLEYADSLDALEIREELVKNHYLREKKRPASRKGKKVPNILHLKYKDAQIFAGKNNLQNQYVTHTLGRREDLWFHVKDYHGSHVVLKAEKADEELIRLCAMLAAWFSKGRYSSSVPVDYTRIHQLKKVPGSKAGFVTMKSFKTIYIDPEESLIEEWIKNYRVK